MDERSYTQVRGCIDKAEHILCIDLDDKPLAVALKAFNWLKSKYGDRFLLLETSPNHYHIISKDFMDFDQAIRIARSCRWNSKAYLKLCERMHCFPRRISAKLIFNRNHVQVKPKPHLLLMDK